MSVFVNIICPICKSNKFVGKLPGRIYYFCSNCLTEIKMGKAITAYKMQDNGKREEVCCLQNKAKITKEQLHEEAKIHGTTLKACDIIAKKYSLSAKTIDNYLSTHGIRKELSKPEEIPTNSIENKITEEPVNASKVEECPFEDALIKADEVIETKDVQQSTIVEEKEKEYTPAQIKSKLRITELSGELMKYRINKSSLQINYRAGGGIVIRIDELNCFIDEMIELRNSIEEG